MKIATTIAAIAVLAACSPPAGSICDPSLGTFEIPHDCEKSERVTVSVATPGRPDPVTPPAAAETPPAADDVRADPPATSKPRGNASMNNGRGGNGGEDNGRGNGKGRQAGDDI